MFLPEGVAPASGVLMMIMNDIFAKFAEWTVVIFDIVLVLTHDYDDAYRKLELVLKKCKYYSSFQARENSFWYITCGVLGYLCESNTYRLTDERKLAVTSILFPQPPNQTNKMQRFLGSAVYFKPFIENYLQCDAPLHDTTKKTFDWNEES